MSRHPRHRRLRFLRRFRPGWGPPIKTGVSKTRIAELVEPTAKRTRATIDSLAAQLDDVFAGATGDRQWGAAGSAAALKAKLLGFMREKIEVGAPGDFSQCDTTEQVVDKLLMDRTPQAALATLDELCELIEQRAANHATIIDAPPPSAPSPGSETALALKTLRPAPRGRR